MPDFQNNKKKIWIREKLGCPYKFKGDIREIAKRSPVTHVPKWKRIRDWED